MHALLQSAVYNLDTVNSVFGHQITDEMRTRIDEETFAELKRLHLQPGVQELILEVYLTDNKCSAFYIPLFRY